MADNVKWKIFAVLLVSVALRVQRATSSQEVMKKLTIGFTKTMETCKKEMNISDDILKDLYNFWREEYELVNREVGCMIMCMAAKMDLVSEDNKLHHQNAHEFAKSHGADDDMAKQLVTILHECETANAANSDDCLKVLEIAKCFRAKIHSLKWAPSVEVILEEIMTEI